MKKVTILLAAVLGLSVASCGKSDHCDTLATKVCEGNKDKDCKAKAKEHFKKEGMTSDACEMANSDKDLVELVKIGAGLSDFGGGDKGGDEPAKE